MANLTNVTVSNSSPTPIISTGWGAVVSVQEAYWTTTWPTTDLLIFHISPLTGQATTVSRRIQQGSAYTFTKGLTNSQVFAPSEVVGYVQAVTGTGVVVVVDEAGS